MKRYRAPDGSLRIWYRPQEIESIAEEELRRAGLMPGLPATAVDVEQLVEDHLQAELDQYAPLPRDVLGVTEFRSGLPPRVLINRALTEAAFESPDPPPGVLGRWRATVAHEAAHILLHRSLSEPDPAQISLLDPSALEAPIQSQRLFRCLAREVEFGGGRDWREVQANRCMAALLMPRSAFLGAVSRAREGIGLLPGEPLRAEAMDPLVRKLARWFGVSRQAARIRLAELGLVSLPGQGSLYLDRPP